jgi:hypothetical protein
LHPLPLGIRARLNKPEAAPFAHGENQADSWTRSDSPLHRPDPQLRLPHSALADARRISNMPFMILKTRLAVLMLLVLTASRILAAEIKIFPEASTPRTLSEWRDSADGKISVCFAVDKTTFGAKETIIVRCAIKNTGDKPLTVLRPFGDDFFALASGINILGPDGAIPYHGAMKEYVLGTSAFLVLPAHAVMDETMELPSALFPGLGQPGLYTIGYQFLSGGYPKQPAPENLWQGQIKTASLTLLIK